MAGDWIKMEVCTPEKAEVLALTARMGWDDADLTVGKLFRLWRWFDQHTSDGNAVGVTAALLDRIVGVTGFCEALTQVGWLKIDEAGICLPNFDRHNGNTAKNRAQTAKRVANHKANAKANDKGNADTVTSALPREEKRREELKEEIHTPRVNNCDEQNPLEPVGSASPEGSASDSCPHFEILDLWKQIVPDLPQPRRSTWSDADRKMLRTRWVWFLTAKNDEGERYATTPDEALQRFAQLFEYVRDNDFLSGRSGSWRCDLRWLLQPKNFGNVLDGRYANREAA